MSRTAATHVMNRTSGRARCQWMMQQACSAAVIECARIMSTASFPCTIIFVTVCGEEQGLLGSDHSGRTAKQNNWNVEAMLNNDIMGSNNSNETNIIDNTKLRVFSEGSPAMTSKKKAAALRQYGPENEWGQLPVGALY